MSETVVCGYRFRDAALAEEAFTHPSLDKTKNERPFNFQRLEFLGDSVLAATVADLLLGLYPDENEGSLAKRHSALVCGPSLARIGRALGLGKLLHLASGDEAEARDNDSNLENACEALIGAIYRDGGYEAAREFILRHWEAPARAQAAPPKDAKTSLQEWAQGQGLALPVYAVIETSGPAHAPEFMIEARVEGQAPATAKAGSKRQAEQLAAKALLDKIDAR